jgi:hypothetical protein
MFLRSLRIMAAAFLLAVFAFVTPVFAQQYTGRIDITIEDATGARLPGVNVEVTGPLNQSMVTDTRGEAHFLNLTVGTYKVKATLAGFSDYQNTNVPVSAGASVPLGIKMTIAGAKETVQVTAETPVIDTKKTGTSTAVSLEELQNVPTARDPWVVMQSVPGIVMDRVNVGGSESGQQSGFMGKGAGSGQTTWNVDGMPITDMSSLSSPFYFDFDMFQEMNVGTGGADVKSSTGGIQLNMMLKAGTNAYHGNARTYFENESMQWSNVPSDLMYLTNQDPTSPFYHKGDRTQQYLDWGGDVGGPILKDRLWFWGAYGKQDIRIMKLSGTTDRTVLPNVSLKVQGQATKAMRASFTFFQANKQKWGRNASTSRTQPTTWNQDGPNQMFKGEVNYVFGNNLFLAGRYAHVKGGFTFDPQGGMTTPAYQDYNGVWHGSFYNYVTDRPQDALVVDANYFKGAHELKFGFTWRKTSVHSTSQWPGPANGTPYWPTFWDPSYNSTGIMYVQPTAESASDGQSKYYSWYVGDTITLKRATVNLGLRYDRQIASVLPTNSAGVTGLALLPTITAPGVSNALTFSLFQPRVGVTYAVDEARKTQLRATYAMFTDQIGTGAASFLSVAQYRWTYFYAIDLNHNGVAEPNEFANADLHVVGLAGVTAADLLAYGGFNPSSPAATTSSINKAGQYGVPRTHEMIFGVDHELMPNLGVSASFTWRKIANTNWRQTMSASGGVLTSANYKQIGTLTHTLGGSTTTPSVGGSPTTVNVPVYGFDTTTGSWDPAKGQIYQTHNGYWQKYLGFEIQAIKRMSNRWMARVAFSTNSWREYWDGTPYASTGDPTSTLGSPNINGGYVVSAAGGSGKSGIYMVQPKYQFSANGAYQLKWDIDLAASFLMRQGYPMPWYQATRLSRTDALGGVGATDPFIGSGGSKNLLFEKDFGQYRLPATTTLDFRVGKTLKFKTMSVNIDLDLFNLFNSATELGRQYNAGTAPAGTTANNAYPNVLEILQPRIARIGFRFHF